MVAPGRKPLSPSYLARVAIAVAVITVWGLLSLGFVSGSWLQGIQRQASGVKGPDTSDVDLLNQPTYRKLLQTARITCPQDKPLLLLNNGSAANQLSDYYFYPRRVISIDGDEPFGRADIEAQKGGCLTTYGPQGAARLEPFKDMVSKVDCSVEGCLYLVK